MISGILLFLLCTAALPVRGQNGQTLMCVAGRDVPKEEFVSYLERNGKLEACSDTSALQAIARQYALRLLMADVAVRLGLDTTDALHGQLAWQRAQLSRPLLTDEAAVERASRARYDMLERTHEAGRVRVRHLFLRLPQNITSGALHRVEERMDSVYGALERGASFDDCARACGAVSDSLWVSRLQMPVEFEDTVFRLKPGSLSYPFFTPQGIHIVKVLGREGFPSFRQVKTVMEDYVLNGKHGAGSVVEKKVEQLKRRFHYLPDKKGMGELLMLGHTTQPLFTLDGRVYDGALFSIFAKSHSYGVRQQLEDFITKSVLDCADDSLEQDYPGFRSGLQSYRDSVLAQAALSYEDSLYGPLEEAEMAAYFDRHKALYAWDTPRFRGMVLHCPNKRKARHVKRFLKTLPQDEWADAVRLVFNSDGRQQIVAEQGTFKPGDNIFVDDKVFGCADAEPLEGFRTVAFLGRKIDGPEHYQEVRALVEKGCREERHRKFLSEMHLLDMVEINQEVLKTVNKQ